MLNTSLSLSLCAYIQVNGDLVGALSRANRADVIRELHLYTGASLDSTDGEGLTALHHAVLEGHLQAVKALIQAFLFFTTVLVPNLLQKKRVSGETHQLNEALILSRASLQAYSTCVPNLLLRSTQVSTE